VNKVNNNNNNNSKSDFSMSCAYSANGSFHVFSNLLLYYSCFLIIVIVIVMSFPYMTRSDLNYLIKLRIKDIHDFEPQQTHQHTKPGHVKETTTTVCTSTLDIETGNLVITSSSRREDLLIQQLLVDQSMAWTLIAMFCFQFAIAVFEINWQSSALKECIAQNSFEYTRKCC
jgi:hypothetical protein